MLNTEELPTCDVVDAPDNYHFEGLCEDCDIKDLSRLSLDQITGRFEQGRVARNVFDAYRWVWAALSPTGSNPHYRNQPYVVDPDVRRIARKLCRVRGFEVPGEMIDKENGS